MQGEPQILYRYLFSTPYLTESPGLLTFGLQKKICIIKK